MARRKENGPKFSKQAEMKFLDKEGFEQATPEIVARYRAKRFGGKVAADLCCGIGMDVISLSEKFEKVYAFDSDERAIDCAKNNAKAYGASNIVFKRQDERLVNLKELGVDFVFADPSRRVAGTRVNGLSETRPDTLKLIEQIKSAGIENFCIEVSNALTPKELPKDCEKEFISLYGEPNCIALYFGKTKKTEYAAVLLPSGKRIESDKSAEWKQEAKTLGKYIFEADEGVVRLGLSEALAQSVSGNIIRFEEGYFTGESITESPFFVNSFEVLESAVKVTDIAQTLQKHGVGKVVLRGKFSEQEQLSLKADIEEGLSGDRKAHAFFFTDGIALCRNLAFRW